ncbi:MAG: class I SAM-dependent methyltransferase [Caulobacterales bacterium]
MTTEMKRHTFGEALVRTACRSCGGPLATVFADLGVQPPANSYLPNAAAISSERAYPLRAMVCSDCKLVQVDTDVPPGELFFDYAYFSSFSPSWLAHAKAFTQMATTRFGLNQNSFVVELASNDGYLLKNFVADAIPCLGIEPSDTVAAAAEQIGVKTLVEFFGVDVARSVAQAQGKADLIVANNVWAHIPDLTDFTAGIAELLKDNGVATIEVQHLLRLMEHVEFDTIYHEHFEYYSLLAAERVFARAGLRVFDVEELKTHGGSLRYFVCHAAAPHPEGATLKKVRADEAAANLKDLATYARFAERVATCREALLEMLTAAKAEGKTVAAYGAAAKGNTLLNFCGVSTDLIVCVADKNPHKQNKLLPGSHIPIVSPEALMAQKPDYVLILPWNLKDEIIAQLADIRTWGGRFITPVPTATIWD